MESCSKLKGLLDEQRRVLERHLDRLEETAVR